MTLSKTHPLYGVLEALGRRDYEKMRAQGTPGSWQPWEELIASVKWLWMKPHAETFCTLEAAGYRVVGPEPTEAMQRHDLVVWEDFDIIDTLHTARNIIAAAPTITETEKGDG